MRRFGHIKVHEDTHRLAKSRASLEGKKLCEWLDEVVKKEAGHKDTKEYGEYNFFKKK